jgi:hypothetical protein
VCLFPVEILMDNQSTKAKKLQLFDELCNSEITVRYVYYSILINYFSFLNRKIFQKQIIDTTGILPANYDDFYNVCYFRISR